MKAIDPPVQLDVVFDRPIGDVWAALTDHSQMIQWYFEQIKRPEILNNQLERALGMLVGTLLQELVVHQGVIGFL